MNCGRTLAFLLGALALLLLPFGQTWAEPVRSLEWSRATPGEPPAADAQWTRLELPARWSTSGAPLQGVVLKMNFAAPPAGAEQWAVLLAQLPSGGRIALNGQLLHTVPSADASRRVSWQRPFLLPLPELALQPGVNTLTIETAHAAGPQTVGAVEAGPLSALLDAYDLRFFFAYTALWIGVAFALPIILFFGPLLRRSDLSLLLLVLAALFWLGYAGSLLLEQQPAALHAGLTALSTLCFGGFAAVVVLTLLQQCAHRQPRLERLTWAYAGVGALMPLALPSGLAVALLTAWQLGLASLMGAALLFAMARSLRGLPAPHPMLQLAGAVLAVATAQSAALSQAWIMMTELPLINLAGPLVLVTLAIPLVDRFARALGEAESARTELENRVREREQLLKRNFERLREGERMQARVAERQRIMQDIHDGLGSQLLSALMLVERRALTNRQVAQVLRESIDDLRLAIDAIASDESNLTGALGNLRYRMEPRLRAAGITLGWDARDLPTEIDVDPAIVLPLLRIVQEALTNALKHSRASKVQVELHLDQAEGQRWLTIRVVDNGRGIADEGVRGRGLLNMRNRAARIGAQFVLEAADGGGTVVQARVPLGEAALKPNGESTTVLDTRNMIEKMRRL